MTVSYWEQRMSVLKKMVMVMSLALGGAGICTAADPIDGRKVFADNCAGCHQAGRIGSRFAPALVKERLGALSNNAVSAMIMTGIPGTLMPPWVHKLSEAEISAVATLIRTNSADSQRCTVVPLSKVTESLDTFNAPGLLIIGRVVTLAMQSNESTLDQSENGTGRLEAVHPDLTGIVDAACATAMTMAASQQLHSI